MTQGKNDFGILKEILKKNKLLAEAGNYYAPVDRNCNVALSDILAIWPCGKNAHFLTKDGLMRSPYTAKNMVEKLADSEYYWALYYAINSESKKKGHYLKPFIAEKTCLQPLNALRGQPVWVNLYYLRDFLETAKGLYLFLAGDYYLLVDQSQRSFLHLLRFSGYYYWSYQLSCHESLLPQELIKKEKSIFKNFVPPEIPFICPWVLFILRGHRKWLVRDQEEDY